MFPLSATRGGRPASILRAAAAALLTLLAVVPCAHAVLPPQDPAWQSPLYTAFFSDLLATESEVWAATREGGLIHLDRATGTLSRIHREPGRLASNELTSIALDRSGRLWVGTAAHGVSRLRADRSGWDLVNRLDGLPVDSVLTLTAVGDTVWIGTTQGLAFWNGREISGSLPDPNVPAFDTTFARTAITGIVQMGDTLWLATRSGVGFAHLSAALTDWRAVNGNVFGGYLDIEDLAWDGTSLVMVGQDYAHYFRFATGDWTLLGTPGVPRTVTDRSGELWLSTTTGVHRWTGTGYLSPAGAPTPFAKVGDPWPDYLRAVAAPDGALFTGTGPYLDRYENATWTRYDVPGPVDNITIGSAFDRGRIYTSTFSGVSRGEGAVWRRWPAVGCGTGCDTTFKNPSFSVGLYADSRGAKWVGSWSISLDRFTDDAAPPSFLHLTEPFVGDTARRRTWTYSGGEDAAGRVWLGMDTPAADDPNQQPIGVSIHLADGTWLGAWSSVNSGMDGDYVRAIERDKYGRMWLGYQARGADFVTPHPADSTRPFDPESFRHLQASELLTVRGIAAYGDTLWLLTETALQRYRLAAPPSTIGATLERSITFPVPGQPGLATRPLAVGLDGSVWAATLDGLWHITRDDTIHYTAENSPLASNTVRTVVVEPGTGAVWIGSAGGIQRFDPSYVPPPPPPQASFRIVPYPNPATRTNAGVLLRLDGAPAGTDGVVYDIGGRRVRTFRLANANQVFWDGRDQDGTLVKPGVYFVRAAAGGQEAFARVVILR